MSKITLLEQKTFQGKPSGFKVTFDDGRSGNLNEKESDKGLRVGDDVIVTEIPYTSKAGVKSTLYGVKLGQNPVAPISTQPHLSEPPVSPQKAVSSFIPANVFSVKADATVKAMEFMVDCFIADKLTWDQIQPKFKELSVYLWDAIDECSK